MIHVTPVDYAILGLLIQAPQSGYQIRMAFEKTALGNFSSSPGSIYPALRRLTNQGLVEKRKTPDGKGERFVITRSGTKALHTWILAPVERKDIEKGTDLLMLRIAFMDTVNRPQAVASFLRSALSTLENYVLELEQFYRQASGDMLPSGRLAFEHGVALQKATIKWLRKVCRQYPLKN